MLKLCLYIFSVILCISAADIHAQDMAKTDSLIENYNFDNALRLLDKSLADEADSLKRQDIEEQIIRCQNGLSLMNFVDTPHTIARKNVSKEEFYLYLPLVDKSWRTVPNKLVQNAREEYPSVVYYPDRAESIFYTDKDESGAWNIYTTEKTASDSIWSFPHLINENITSSGNEIYPMLSPDGKTLYFASDGLFGTGGYDIYVSSLDRDTGEWGEPQNLGFPYSSPANDILYAVSHDEKYAMLVSDRLTGPESDSLTIFIMKYEQLAIRKKISEPDSLMSIAMLKPVSDDTDNNLDREEESPFGENTEDYASLLKEIRTLRDSIAVHALTLNDLRQVLDNIDNDTEKSTALEELVIAENRMSSLTDSLNARNLRLQKIEMDFLMNGLIIDPDEAMKNLNRKDSTGHEDFTFVNHSHGGIFELMVEMPVKRFDYSFKILPKGQFAEDNTLPGGLVYQIQIFATTAPAGVKSLRGLSPVFERKPSPGKYIYSVGLFDSYNEALSKLNKVKKQGFRQAFIIAFMNGERIDLQKARQTEKKQTRQTYQICISAETSLDPRIREIMQENGITKDIIRGTDSNGNDAYIIGPFPSENEVRDITGKIVSEGIEGVTIENITTERQ